MFIHRMTATQCAIVSMNVPHWRLIDENTFDGLLYGTVPVAKWIFHLEIFFSDVPLSIIQKIMQEKNIDISILSALYFQLPETCQKKTFKEFLDANMGIIACTSNSSN